MKFSEKEEKIKLRKRTFQRARIRTISWKVDITNMAEAGGSGHDKLLLPSTTILYTLAKKLGTLVFRHTYQMYKNLEKGSKIAMDY